MIVSPEQNNAVVSPSPQVSGAAAPVWIMSVLQHHVCHHPRCHKISHPRSYSSHLHEALVPDAHVLRHHVRPHLSAHEQNEVIDVREDEERENGCEKHGHPGAVVLPKHLQTQDTTEEASVEQELPGEQACDDGEDPHQDLQDVPSSSGIFIDHEREAVPHHDHVRLRLAVRHRVLGEDQEVEEGDEVGHHQTRPGVLEVIAEAGAEDAQTLSSQTVVERFRGHRRVSACVQ